MIEKETIEKIKTSIDLKTYIESREIPLKKNGKGYMGLCPFHNDTNPSLSVTPEKQLWKCFGCDKGGDVIRFVELFDRVEFKEAVKRLNSGAVHAIPIMASAPTVKEYKILAKVVGYYQHTFLKDTRGLEYIKQRGITKNDSFNDFAIGFVNGSLFDILPDDEQIISTLKKIGVLNKKGQEFFYNCVVFPLYDTDGSIVNLYGRNIDDNSPVSHLYLPGKRSGIVNRQAVKRSPTILLTESVIDALTLYDQGFKNVVPIYGVNGLTEDHLLFFNRKIKEAYLVFDADEAGKRATETVSTQLKEKGIVSYPVTLPDKNVNVYFRRHTPEEFELLLKAANPNSLEQSDTVGKRSQSLYKETEYGFIVGYGGREYEIKGIQRAETQLKVTIKASREVEGNLSFELTTIDLYSYRSRQWLAKTCSSLFGATEELVKEDLGKILTLVESYQPHKQKPQAKEATQAEKEEALRFLKNPNMFNELLKDLEIIGVVGEATNKIVCFLCAVSRRLPKPLSVLIQSRSGAGKSTIQNCVSEIIPQEEYEKYTRVTDQALFYKEEDSLVHKILAVEEEAGVKGAAYSIRNIQSTGEITVATTGKDPKTGKMRTEQYKVKGPVAVMLTTTDPDLDQETASRFIHLSIDESHEMTAAIHKKQREARTLARLIDRKKADKLIRKHHVAQRLLKPIAVVNNYSEYLNYPNTNLITRRDHEKYLGLIETIAFCRQYQRKIQTTEVDGDIIEYIEVSLDDVDLANTIADEVLGQSLDELTRPSRTLLDLIYKMVREIADRHNTQLDEIYLNRSMIREYTGWSDWQIKRYIKQLEELEYLYVRIVSRGKEYSYALNYQGQGETGHKFFLNLTPVAEITRKLQENTKK